MFTAEKAEMKEQGRASRLYWPRRPLPLALVCLLATCGDGIGGRYGGEAGYVWYVDGDAPGPGHDGKTWTTAFLHPCDALDRARSGDEIWVAEGTYARRGSGDTVLLTMKDGVSIYGGFAATETSRDERDWTTHVTTLDGETLVYHVVVGASDASLDGFTITGGNADGSDFDLFGGGMYNADVSNLTVTNCTFSGNTSNSHGGGIWNRRCASPTVANSTFSGNTAGASGGGMYNGSVTNLAVANCTFSGNMVGNFGGGMYNASSSGTVVKCAFSGNAASLYGGGMCSLSSSPTVTNCTFSKNTAGERGGGMYNWDSSPTVANCTFSGNSTDFGGGMYNSVSCSPAVTNCTFSGNTAAWDGGGMRNFASSPTVTNCTFLGNSAAYEGGGMDNYLDSSPTVTNCILWGNSAPTGPELRNNPGAPTLSYSDVQGCGGSGAGWDASVGSDGGGNIDSDPFFVDADGADNIAGTADDDLRLLLGSPCIDAGTSSGAPSNDLDGNPRPAGAGYDMGAYEYQP